MAYWRAALLVLTTHVAFSQMRSHDLNRDPVFTTILQRHLQYPMEAQWASIYDRLYTEFEVDEKGHIQHISILHSISRDTRYGFEQAIQKALQKMPSLNIGYTGSYILPVSFIYLDYRHKNPPLIPKDSLGFRLRDEDLIGHVLLNEVKIFGTTANSKERGRSAARNEGY